MKDILKVLKKIDNGVERSQTYFSVTLYFFAMWLVFFAVFFRYVLNDSIVWAEEILRYLVMWVILVGSSLTIREDGHVCIDFLQSLLKHKYKIRIVLYIFTRSVAVLFMLLLLPHSFDLLARSAGGHSASLTWLPIAAVYWAFPLGVLSMTLAYISQVPRKIKSLLEEDRAYRAAKTEPASNKR